MCSSKIFFRILRSNIYTKRCTILTIFKCKKKVNITQSCSILCDPMDRGPARLLCPWNSPGHNTGVGSHSLLQVIFLTQGSNPGHSHCRQILYCLSHQGSPFLNVQISNAKYMHIVVQPISRMLFILKNQSSTCTKQLPRPPSH